MFSQIVPENREASWKTTPMRERNTSSGSSAVSCPATRTWPSRASYRPSSRFTIVDLPPPDSPTSATFSPGTTAKRSEEHTSELQSRGHLVCRLLLEKKKQTKSTDA